MAPAAARAAGARTPAPGTSNTNAARDDRRTGCYPAARGAGRRRAARRQVAASRGAAGRRPPGQQQAAALAPTTSSRRPGAAWGRVVVGASASSIRPPVLSFLRLLPASLHGAAAPAALRSFCFCRQPRAAAAAAPRQQAASMHELPAGRQQEGSSRRAAPDARPA